MILIYVVLGALLIVIIKDYVQGFKVSITASINEDCAFLHIMYLYPFIRIAIESDYSRPYLICYIFNHKIFRSELIKRKKTAGSIQGKRFMKAAHISEINIAAAYGLQDPSMIGLVFAIMRMISSYMRIDNFELSPDFVANRAYFYCSADAKIKVGHTIMDYIQNK
jgi:hypothetical protein